MKTMTTFEENPPNSPQNVVDVLEANFNIGASGVPKRLLDLTAMMGAEKEEWGGVAAMKVCVIDFTSQRYGDFSSGLVVIPVLTVDEFDEFLFSPEFNSAKVVQGLDHSSTTQSVCPGVLGQIPGVTLNPTMRKILMVKPYMGSGWERDFPDLDGGKTPDLFVKLSIQGLPIDEKTVKTKVKKNCWTPIWGEEFEFQLCSPEDAWLLIEVYDRDRFKRNDFAGAISLPVSELRMGIHAIPLFYQNGIQCSAARLLVRFMFV